MDFFAASDIDIFVCLLNETDPCCILQLENSIPESAIEGS